MKLDDRKIDEAVLALLAVFSFDEGRAWKGFSWEVMERLHAQGLISNPRGKTKSVVLSEEGLRQGQAIAARMFSSQPAVGD